VVAGHPPGETGFHHQVLALFGDLTEPPVEVQVDLFVLLREPVELDERDALLVREFTKDVTPLTWS